MTGPADRLIVGRIATLAGPSGLGYVESIAIRDGVVLHAGDLTVVEELAGARTERWRLAPGTCAMPGITDAHLHLGVAAMAAAGVRLGGLLDRDAVWAAIADAHAQRISAGDVDGWLLGDGWSIDQMGGWPTAADLERIAPARPVALWSHDHHARWASQTALTLAGIHGPDRGTTGLVRLDEQGTPTGVLHESAATLVDRVIPDATPAARVSALESYAHALAVLGVTGVHDPGDLAVPISIDSGPGFFRELAEGGRLPLRVAASVRAIQLDAAVAVGLRTGHGIGRYRGGWLKLFADGALGSRSAALLRPYEPDDPAGVPTGGPSGMVTGSPVEWRRLAARAAAHGIATQIHGIGDAAVRTALDVLEAAPRVPGVAHRVEHAQLVDPADVPRFARSGIAASVQPCHLCSDAPAARMAWGDRVRHAFPLAALATSGALIPMGTDAPVESPDPWRNLAAAVLRRDPAWPDDVLAFVPDQAITLERAIRAACLDPALSLGPSGPGSRGAGRLVPGSPADLIVIPDDGLRDPGHRGEHLAATRPMAALIDGVLVHQDPSFDP